MNRFVPSPGRACRPATLSRLTAGEGFCIMNFSCYISPSPVLNPFKLIRERGTKGVRALPHTGSLPFHNPYLFLGEPIQIVHQPVYLFIKSINFLLD